MHCYGLRPFLACCLAIWNVIQLRWIMHVPSGTSSDHSMLGSSTIPAIWFGVTLLFPRIVVDALLRSSTIPCRLHRYLEGLSGLVQCDVVTLGPPAQKDDTD